MFDTKAQHGIRVSNFGTYSKKHGCLTRGTKMGYFYKLRICHTRKYLTQDTKAVYTF